MRALITVESTRASNGGTSRSVTGLCGALQANGVAVRLLAGISPREQSILPCRSVEAVLVAEDNAPIQFPVSYYRALKREVSVNRPDIVHDNGIWRPSNWIAATVARKARVPLVVSSRGMLSQWALQHRFWKKRVAWHAYQKRALESAAALHATSDEEASELRQLGFGHPIAVIPNAVRVPQQNGEREGTDRYPRRALFMSRLHPKKGLPLLIEAWSQVRPTNWILEIAGPDEGGHLAQMTSLVAERGLDEEITFVGDVGDDKKWDVYQHADLFILPSHGENFGIAIAEALATAVPVITTTSTPWSSIRDLGCGWWVSPDVVSIATALREAVSRPAASLRQMGQRGRKLIENEFSWRRVANETKQLYEWIVSGGPRPGFVSVD